MRDVIFKRVGSKVRVTDSGSGNYQARLNLDIAGLPAAFIRGYNWVDARSARRSSASSTLTWRRSAPTWHCSRRRS